MLLLALSAMPLLVGIVKENIMSDSLIGKTFEIEHFNIKKKDIEVVDVVLESIIDGPEHDPRDHVIITHPINGEMSMPLPTFITAVEKALGLA